MGDNFLDNLIGVKNIGETIKDACNNAKCELAHLYFQAKDEYLIRDKLAYYLAEKLKDKQKYFVVREWKCHKGKSESIDLAILEKNEENEWFPIALFEFKCELTYHSFDWIEKRCEKEIDGNKNVKWLPVWMYKDLARMSDFSEINSWCYEIIIGVNFKKKVNADYIGINPHYEVINNNKNFDENDLYKRISKELKKECLKQICLKRRNSKCNKCADAKIEYICIAQNQCDNKEECSSASCKVGNLKSWKIIEPIQIALSDNIELYFWILSNKVKP